MSAKSFNSRGMPYSTVGRNHVFIPFLSASQVREPLIWAAACTMRFSRHPALTYEVCVLTVPVVSNSTPGSLYVVATPIGNLDDMSVRALKVLREVALIAAEDTRHSARLMQHFGISTPLAACHEHNERDESSRFITRLLAGDDIALISDAGTPLISDPGYHLVRQARAAGVPVVP
ncbi:hypothetical protein ALP71_04719, partial [Pseudomonas coronafaciens pv. garcae]